jgi:hyperosmotically inducible protein
MKEAKRRMRSTSLMKQIVVSGAMWGLTIAVPAVAQDNPGNPSASESMHQAGESAEQAGSHALSAAKNAAKGTARAMRDTKITAKVKAALHEAGISEKSGIHVTTTAGVVKLSGRVPSSATAARAEQVALQTEGVRSVTNDLRVGGPVQSD